MPWTLPVALVDAADRRRARRHGGRLAMVPRAAPHPRAGPHGRANSPVRRPVARDKHHVDAGQRECGGYRRGDAVGFVVGRDDDGYGRHEPMVARLA